MGESANNPAGGATILLLDTDPVILEGLGQFLTRDGYDVVTASSTAEALRLLAGQAIQVAIAEVSADGVDGFELLRAANADHPDVVVIFMTSYGSIDSAVEAIRQGAHDYLTKPVVDDDVRLAVGRALAQQRLIAENRRLKAAAGPATPFDRIVGEDYRMVRVFELIDAVADSRATVLITGESGTGKSLVAGAIHDRSRRRGRPFIEVACGALPETLLESELFGHVKGAFTGAVADRMGKFAAADGGTIFLDEISGASPAFQMKLLRFLQERTFEPVGANRTLGVDVRVILASNRDLWAEVEAGRFRRDLYYRVNVVNIDLPPLRDRTGDTPLLAEHFLGRFRRDNARAIAGFTDAASRVMRSYPWPGNVRELENAVERAVVLCRGGWIDVGDLPATVSAAGDASADGAHTPGRTAPTDAMTLTEALAEPEKRIIQSALAGHGGNRQATARALGINRTTLYKKMRKHGLLPPRPTVPHRRAVPTAAARWRETENELDDGGD